MFELGHLTDRKPPFRYAAYTRVAFSDTDAQAVVYYGRYMPYFDLARTEYARHLGRTELGVGDFAMRACGIDYHAPARFDDLLEIFVRIGRMGRTSMTYELAAFRVDEDGADHLLVTATQTVVNLNLVTRETLEIPAAFRKRIETFEQGGS